MPALKIKKVREKERKWERESTQCQIRETVGIQPLLCTTEGERAD